MMKEMNPRHGDIASALPADLDALPRRGKVKRKKAEGRSRKEEVRIERMG
jgi:hypothetical protein